MPAARQSARNIARSAESIEMLKAVIDGHTYEAVASEFGITRTAVERRTKAIARRLSQDVGIEGLNPGGVAFVRRLRLKRDAVRAALEKFEPPAPFGPREIRVVSDAEIAQAVQRIRGRSSLPLRDTALFYMLFATGARPLEIARLEVRDYLDAEGRVRQHSELRMEAAITGKARDLYFASEKLDAAMSLYLDERVTRRQGVTEGEGRRGLDPQSRLFLTAEGEGFRITPYGEPGQHRFLCRPILETYRKLFRYAEVQGVTPLSVRHTLAARLYDRGADEEQVGLLLGISERSSVRELYPRSKPTLAQLVNDLV